MKSWLAPVTTSVFIALRQLWDRKGLNGIAVGGVALGVLVLVAMSGILAGFQQKFTSVILKISPHIILFDTELRSRVPALASYAGTRVAAHVAHEAPADRQEHIKRPYELAGAMRVLPEVEAAAPSISGMALVEFGSITRSLDVRGIDLDRQIAVTPLQEYVKAGRLQDLMTKGDAIVLGAGVARDLGAHVDDTVHVIAPGGTPMDLKVVTIFEAEVPPVDKVRGYMRLNVAQALLGRPDAISRIEVRLRDERDAVRITDTLERMFGYDCESWRESNANFLSIFATQNMVVNMVIGAILLVGGFGILAVQIMIVIQKTRDIAILRSVGLRRVDILRIFLIQGVLIAIAGGCTGDICGKIAIYYLAKLPVKIEGSIKADTFLVHDSPAYYLWGFAFALLIGVVASLVPAYRASRVEPVDVLRGQIG